MRNILTLALLMVATGTWAQTMNLNFETWNSSGQPSPFNWEEPAEWTSTNAQTEWTSAGIRKSPKAYQGSYSMQLLSVNINSGWYSMACLGKPKAGSDPNKPELDLITGGKPISYKPEKLTGHYLLNAHVAARGKAVVILKKFNPTTGSRDTIGYGQTFLPPTEHFSSFEVDIDYRSTEQPDSVIIAFYSDDPGNPHAPPAWIHDGLLIDNLNLEQPNSISAQVPAQEELKVYPNPSTGNFKIKFPGLIEEHPYRLMNYLNSVQFVGKLQGDQLELDLEPGRYLLEIEVEGNLHYTPIFIIP
ncbi:hypothetical protein KFE98_05710 [bacterium SCSIO 12741]|nr:hypothetical protein KFE98_05710 [bacterium SCSIO 12741]